MGWANTASVVDGVVSILILLLIFWWFMEKKIIDDRSQWSRGFDGCMAFRINKNPVKNPNDYGTDDWGYFRIGWKAAKFILDGGFRK